MPLSQTSNTTVTNQTLTRQCRCHKPVSDQVMPWWGHKPAFDQAMPLSQTSRWPGNVPDQEMPRSQTSLLTRQCQGHKPVMTRKCHCQKNSFLPGNVNVTMPLSQCHCHKSIYDKAMPLSQTSQGPGNAIATNQYLTRKCDGHKPVSWPGNVTVTQTIFWPENAKLVMQLSQTRLWLSPTRPWPGYAMVRSQTSLLTWQWHGHKPVPDREMPLSQTSHWLGNATVTNQ